METTAPYDGGLVERYVEKILNDHASSVIPEIFSARYRDHDPLLLPGSPPSRSSLENLRSFLGFLSAPTVDAHFHLMDSFPSACGSKIAFRIRGEGTVVVGTRAADGDRTLIDIGGDAGAEVSVPNARLGRGKLLGQRLHMEYYVNGIFRVEAGQIQERWGYEYLR